MTSTARVGAGHARPAIAPPGAAIIGTTHHNALRGWKRAHHDAPLHTDHHAITNHAWHRTICPDTDRARRGRACPACHSSRAHHGLDVSPTNAHRLLSVGERHASPVAMTSHAPWPFDHAHSLAAARSTSSIRSTASASPAHGTAQLVSGASRCAPTARPHRGGTCAARPSFRSAVPSITTHDVDEREIRGHHTHFLREFPRGCHDERVESNGQHRGRAYPARHRINTGPPSFI